MEFPDKVIADLTGKSEKEISRRVIEQLQKIPKRSNKKNKLETPDMQHMRNFLGIKEN